MKHGNIFIYFPLIKLFYFSIYVGFLLFDTNYKNINFKVETFIKSIEWLYLAAKGHRRAFFDLNNDNVEKKWLIP